MSFLPVSDFCLIECARCLGVKENVLPVSKWALSDSMLPSQRQESKQPLSFSPIESPETMRISAG